MPSLERTIAPQISIEDMRNLEGTFVDIDRPDEWTILHPHPEYDHVRITKEDTGTLLCCVQRNAIPHELCQLGVDCYMQVGKMVSSNRGVAAGMQHRDTSGVSYQKGIDANSSIMGYMDSTHYKRPCRLTAFSQKHMEKYHRGLPFIKAIDRCFATCVSDAHARQTGEAKLTDYHIKDTAFSTVTVNYNFRTAVHRDAGDFEQGFGNLVVCQNDVQGGWLLFPRYRVAVVLQTGDFLAMDVHEWHCNTPIHPTTPEGYRLSFVCYLRNRMRDCNRINERLSHFARDDGISTQEICRQIFELVHEPLPEKTVIGTSKNGVEWWSYQGNRFHLIYKNRRFLLHDVLRHHTVHNLWPAWEYAKELV